MADKEPEKRRALAAKPKAEIGQKLEAIRGQDVEVRSISFVTRNGEDGEYDLALITVGPNDDLYHVGGKAVREYLATIDADDLPLWMTFDKVRSKAGREYWDVVA